MPTRSLVLPRPLGGRVFTRADAGRHGATPALFRTTAVRRVWPSVYADSRLPDGPLLRLEGVRLVAPETWGTCYTAAALLRLPVPDDSATHVGYPPGRTRLRWPGLEPHAVTVSPHPADLTTVGGLLVESPLATFVRMRLHLGLVDLVVLGDAVARRCAGGADSVRVAAETIGGRGARRLRRAAGLVRDRVDSPMETRLRLLIVLAGLPEPAVGHEIRADDGEPLFAFDLSYPRLRLAIEYDGADHASARRRSRDAKRRERLDSLGWRVIVVTAADLYGAPAATLLRVHAALCELAGDVPEPGAGWRPYFS